MITRRTPIKRSTKPIKRSTKSIARRSHKMSGSPAKARQKAITLVMSEYRGKPCAVCGTIHGTAGHHILHQGTHQNLAAERINIIPLCQIHHSVAHDYADTFMKWMSFNLPTTQLEWIEENRNNHTKTDWIDKLDEMRS